MLKKSKKYLLNCVWLCMLLVCIKIIFFPDIASLLRPSDSQLHNCRYYMLGIYDALYKYKEDYGSFPPSYTVDKNGKLQHSWRVLILPYLDGKVSALNNYDYNQSWDSPHNQQFRENMPSIFKCPYSYAYSLSNSPSYALITKENPIDNLSSDHFILVEIKDAKFNWLEPVDFYTRDPLSLKPPSRSELSKLGSLGCYHDHDAWFHSPKTTVMTKDRQIITIFIRQSSRK
jgi:hypothetical protein